MADIEFTPDVNNMTVRDVYAESASFVVTDGKSRVLITAFGADGVYQCGVGTAPAPTAFYYQPGYEKIFEILSIDRWKISVHDYAPDKESIILPVGPFAVFRINDMEKAREGVPHFLVVIC